MQLKKTCAAHVSTGKRNVLLKPHFIGQLILTCLTSKMVDTGKPPYEAVLDKVLNSDTWKMEQSKTRSVF